MVLNIPVEIAAPSTGMAQAVLIELIDHMHDLLETGTEHVIDVTSLPMSDSDRRELSTLLGRGEVSVTLNTIGDSEIYETAFSGVWWIKHFTTEQHLIAELIEVTTVPGILKSHPDDIKKSLQDLKQLSIPLKQEKGHE